MIIFVQLFPKHQPPGPGAGCTGEQEGTVLTPRSLCLAGETHLTPRAGEGAREHSRWEAACAEVLSWGPCWILQDSQADHPGPLGRMLGRQGQWGRGAKGSFEGGLSGWVCRNVERG